jgi:putative transcriptional regulator
MDHAESDPEAPPDRDAGTGSDAGSDAGPDSDPDPDESPRADLAEKIAGEVTLSDAPGATIRKWRTDFDVTQTDLAEELGVSSSVVSDYESGRRESPGTGVISRIVRGLLDIDERRGGARIRQYGRVLSAGFTSDAVLDLREYPTSVPLAEVYDRVGATEVAPGDRDRISGHTVIDSIRAITRLSSDEFYRLYGQSTNRVLVFTNVSRGESPLVALRVVDPTPNAVILHGISEADLWDHAADLATIDGYSLAVSETPREELLEAFGDLP